MIDRMQSEYKKYVDSKMEPSEEFLAGLTQRLREEADRDGMPQAEQGGRDPGDRIKSVTGRGRFLYFAAAAAVLALAVGITTFSYLRWSREPQGGEAPSAPEGNLSHYAGETDAKPGQGNIIGNPGWWDESLTTESLPKALAQKMETSLERLSRSEDNKFVDAQPEEEAEIRRIIGQLEEAVSTDQKILTEERSDMTVYYMAVFTDGTVAKFRVADETDLVISGEETVYKIK